ncbi:hypothetical protein SAMN04487819_11655 [Actinopolyspora alba]|uniref:Uncharacterized protein n=1 Tax=Actinopolyspora alba TaxID=673379 RepID=A0A1I2BE24_9ACTN|nr:hypothetical protein [Actinopolyspora alba]SFE54395.1 hypothetical protein SAMN04487819_11655 [Actinopolyspora alba]
MEAGEVYLDINGPHGQMDPRALTEGLNHLLKLLEKLQPADDKPEWNITGLQLGSYKVELRGRPDVATTVSRGLDELAERPGIPTGWSPDAVRQVTKLGKVREKRGVDDVRIALGKTLALIDEALLHNAEKSLERWPDSIGSIQGRLFRYNDSTWIAGVTDEVTLQTVEIKVPDELRRTVASAVTYDVCAWGMMHHNADGQVDRITLEKIDVLPDPGPPARIDELVNILGSDWTGGMDPVEVVRRQRD